jgi:hypothetical protein
VAGSLRRPYQGRSPQWDDGRGEADLSRAEREWFYEVTVLSVTGITPQEFDELTFEQTDMLLAAHEARQYREAYQRTRESVFSMTLKTAQRHALDLELEAKEAEERHWQERAFEKLQPKRPEHVPEYKDVPKQQLPDWLTPRAALGLLDMNEKGYFRKNPPMEIMPFWDTIGVLARKEKQKE